MTAPPAFRLIDVVAGPSLEAPILRDVSVDIPCEGLTAVAGPSGSGKSTLLRLLNRLDDPLAGRVLLDGVDLRERVPSELRREVGMIFQRPPVFAGTVLENLRVARPDVDPDRSAHVLHHVGLDPSLLDRQAVDLSGGEAQRMCIARALLTEPDILLADEPTSALDGEARDTIESLAAEIVADGVPIVWITHDTDQLERLADHALVIDGGRVTAFGHVDELRAHDDPSVRRLTGGR